MNTKFLSKRFFDKNYKIILKGSCSALRVNELLVTFFGKKIAKTVKYKDVALGLVKYLFEKGIVVDQKKLNSLCNNSNFLEKYVKIPLEKIVEKTLKANPISEEEIKAIDSRKGLEYIKESNRKEIADDISELKKEKEELLKSLPSILDNESFEEPKQDADIYKNREVWWQKLNLISDPFPTQNGLSKIDKKMYDDVVIKTDSFKRIVNLFKQDPKNFFNKGTLLSGGFGTGKTTAIDYLGYFIKENYNYASLTITFDQQRDVIDYIQRFKFELLKELKKISNQFDIELNNLSPDLECDIPWLMMELSDHDIDGIIVFIDDLHKHTNRDLVFDFLSQMQIVKNNLIKENLNVGFIVSGTKQWEKSLLKDTRLTGFFDNASIEIENPTPETIFEVISKRLNAFLYNKDKKLVIDMEYIRRIYDKAKTEGFKNGYRGFINEVVNELRSGITNLFEIDPIILEKDKKEKIREMIESNSIVYKKINSFLHGNSEFKNESKKRGVRILSSIYLKNGVLEEDDYFRKNVFSFRLLNDAQLIQRSRTSDGKLKWVVDQNLLELNKGIKQIYGCSLEDYLENIFFEVVSNDKNKQYSLDDEKVKQIDLFLKTIKGNMNSLAYEQFKSSFEIYKDVLVNFSLKKIKESEYVNFIDRCNNSLRLLSSTIFLIEDISSELKLKKFTEAWVYHWNGIPEVLSEFVSEIENIDKIKEEKLSIIKNKYLTAYEGLYDFLNSCLSTPFLNNNKKYLNRNEIKLFNDLFYDLAHQTNSDDNFQIVKKLNDFIEIKFRNCLFNFSSIIFGEKYSDRIANIPLNLRKYLETNKKNKSDRYNEFEGLNRGQYRELNNVKNIPFASLIWEKIFSNFDINDRNFFIEQFCELNLKTSHNKISSIEASDFYLVDKYLKLSIELFKGINKFYIDVISSFFYLLTDTNISVITPLFKGDKLLTTISEKDFSFFTQLNKYHLDEKEISKLFEMISNNGQLIVNLEESYEMPILLSKKYISSIFEIASLINRKKISIEILYGTEVILIT